MSEPTFRTRFLRWRHRVLFGAPGVPLGFYQEFWRRDVDPNREATHWLLLDIVHAAGGIEYTTRKLGDLMAAVQVWADANVPREMLDEPAPLYGRGVSTPELENVAWEYGNLLAWARAFEDRMRRDPAPGSGDHRELGLLAALAPDRPETAEIGALWKDFKSRNLLTDVKHQAALSLHSQTVHHTGQGARLDDDGRVRMPAPDPLSKRAGHRGDLTFEQGRDVLTFATTLLDGVSTFVDAMLDVFEAWTARIQQERREHAPQKIRAPQGEDESAC